MSKPASFTYNQLQFMHLLCILDIVWLAAMCYYRNEELIGLQGKDISSMMKTNSDTPYFMITLTFHKTNYSDEKEGVYCCQVH